MRITLDATPLLGPRTGIGRYTERLLNALPAALQRRGIEPQVRVTTWTARGGRLTDLPPGVTQTGPRLPARLLLACAGCCTFSSTSTFEMVSVGALVAADTARVSENTTSAHTAGDSVALTRMHEVVKAPTRQ